MSPRSVGRPDSPQIGTIAKAATFDLRAKCEARVFHGETSEYGGRLVLQPQRSSVQLQAHHIKRERSEHSDCACQLQRLVGPSRALTPPY